MLVYDPRRWLAGSRPHYEEGRDILISRAINGCGRVSVVWSHDVCVELGGNFVMQDNAVGSCIERRVLNTELIVY